ncbi:S8 family peptidase [Roseibium alexandrii]|uniref:Minor extracellular protease vpr n=1 Tax=Roseibium alexandrii TaxID=388408 RepID=A0A0M7ACG1_9HYPH|nr:S8 family serine peptidase [Roseibium alexandrii]CTQ72768.1 Minor extracellular protease vpr precursor [Roseibium alexandrii]
MATLGENLKTRLETMKDHDTVDVVVYVSNDGADEQMVLSESIDSDEPASRSEYVGQLRQAVDERQKGLLSFVQEETASPSARLMALDEGPSVTAARVIDRFWINNSVRMELTRAAVIAIADRSDVTHIEMVTPTDLDEILDNVTFPGALQVEAVALDADTPKPTWSVKHINAHLMWSLGYRGKDVLVAVIDTGVNYRHPDLMGRMWQSADYPKHGYDFSGNGDPDPMDEHHGGHGTKCAGIVAGDGTMGQATGVAPEATIMAIRMGNDEPAMFRCLEFAIDQGADVISMSLTWKYDKSPDYPGWRRACETVAKARISHANSSGNQGNKLVGFPIPYNIGAPGNCPSPWLNPNLPQAGGTCSPVTCGASNSSDRLSYSSGRGPVAWEDGAYADYPYDAGGEPGLVKPDICAPGPGTTSCSSKYDPDAANTAPYAGFGGTSAATPHVAGCMALLISVCKANGAVPTPERIQEALETTAVRMVGQTKDKENHYGSGRVDVFAAYKFGVEKGWWPPVDQELPVA